MLRGLLIGIALSLWAAPSALPQGARSAPKPAAPALDVAGAMCGIKQTRQVVVRDAKAFDALWTELSQGVPQTIKPKMDFAKHDLVAVFAGSKPTGGYMIKIGDIRRSGKTATVNVMLSKPAPDAITIQVITSPFALRAVPKLPPTVRFIVKE